MTSRTGISVFHICCSPTERFHKLQQDLCHISCYNIYLSLLGLLAGANGRCDGIYYTLWLVSISSDALWPERCSCNIPTLEGHSIAGSTGFLKDDLAIHSDSLDTHLQHVRTVLQRLREAGLTAKPKKCQFGMDQCVYLGYVVSNE